jgi:hypothetical protein
MKIDRETPDRTHGQLNGFTLRVQQHAAQAAAREGISLHEWLDRVVLAAALPGGKA